jgi:aspartate carbamoyltransferase catalytic subunit
MGGILSAHISRKGEPVPQTVEVLLTYAAVVRHANDTAVYF